MEDWINNVKLVRKLAENVKENAVEIVLICVKLKEIEKQFNN